jgi:pimeloyl-ACP methyl ester carboxylesterase
MSVQPGFAEVNGTRLYYEAVGDGSALVLVHGFTLDTRMWDAQVDELARHYRVVRYDQRGFGRSALPGSEPYTHTDDLRALLEYLGIDVAAAVVGLSAGGEVALGLALAYPAALRALVLADAVVEGHKWSARWDAAVIPVWQGARQEGIAVGKARWLAHQGLFGPAQEQPAVAAGLARMVEDYSGWHWVNRDPQRRAAVPAIERLDQLHLPTLVVVGERDDADFQAQADALARGIPGARKAVIPGVGHMSNMEDPATFNRLVLDFLAEVGP